jgi:hypothetical protein
MATKQPQAVLLKKLARELHFLHVGNSLLFLAKVLLASRQQVQDPVATQNLARHPRPLPAFAVHLLVKLLMRHGRQNTPTALDWPRFHRMFPVAMQLAIDDPLNSSSDEAVGTYVLRMMTQQMNRHVDMQSYGLALGLFQDLEAITDPLQFNLRAEIEGALNMPIEVFMRIGCGAAAAARAQHDGLALPGTIDGDWVLKAAEQIPAVPWATAWPHFLRAVACTQAEFNAMVDQLSLGAADRGFLAYEFNPLRRKPLIAVGEGRYVCADNQMLASRTSWGVFQDAYERKRKGFQGPFGHAFERFVGKVLRSAVPRGALWGERESPRVRELRAGSQPHHKLADWICRTRDSNVFIECKSVRPTLQMSTFANVDDLKKLAGDFAKAIRQVVEHAESVNQGDWAGEGLLPREAGFLVVTLGRIETVNGPFFRKWIDEQLTALGIHSPRYVVLSLEELDSVVRLVELGHEFGQVIQTLSSEPSFDPLMHYAEDLRDCAASRFALDRANRMWNFLPQPIDAVEGLATPGADGQLGALRSPIPPSPVD